MVTIQIPVDLENELNVAWRKTDKVPGHLLENEARFLGLLAACTPGSGKIVEIGSFKGRSTVMLATVAAHYELGPVVAIDPHNSPILLDIANNPEASTCQDFLHSINTAGVSDHVEPHLAYSAEVAKTWNRPIRVLWIDGDHSYEAVKEDLEGFLPHMEPYGVVAMHDALNVCPGPIRVFVEDILRSDRFGPAGFVHSIAWAQFRPNDGNRFQKQRRALDRSASRLIPFVQDGKDLHGFVKKLYKFNRFRIPHSAIEPRAWASQIMNSE